MSEEFNSIFQDVSTKIESEKDMFAYTAFISDDRLWFVLKAWTKHDFENISDLFYDLESKIISLLKYSDIRIAYAITYPSDFYRVTGNGTLKNHFDETFHKKDELSALDIQYFNAIKKSAINKMEYALIVFAREVNVTTEKAIEKFEKLHNLVAKKLNSENCQVYSRYVINEDIDSSMLTIFVLKANSSEEEEQRQRYIQAEIYELAGNIDRETKLINIPQEEIIDNNELKIFLSHFKTSLKELFPTLEINDITSISYLRYKIEYGKLTLQTKED